MTVDQATYSQNENHTEMSSQEIGFIFAREYYTFLNRKPNRLHAFFSADSLFVRGVEAEYVPVLKGQEEIRRKIEELHFDNCKVLVTQVDSQLSANNAPQPNGYYVLNNIFRFLKEKINIDYQSFEDEETIDVVQPENHLVEKQENNVPVQDKEVKKEVPEVMEETIPLEKEVFVEKDHMEKVSNDKPEIHESTIDEKKAELDVMDETLSEKVPIMQEQNIDTKSATVEGLDSNEAKSTAVEVKSTELSNANGSMTKGKSLKKASSVESKEEQPKPSHQDSPKQQQQQQTDRKVDNKHLPKNNHIKKTQKKKVEEPSAVDSHNKVREPDTTENIPKVQENPPGKKSHAENGTKTWASLAAPSPAVANEKPIQQHNPFDQRPQYTFSTYHHTQNNGSQHQQQQRHVNTQYNHHPHHQQQNNHHQYHAQNNHHHQQSNYQQQHNHQQQQNYKEGHQHRRETVIFVKNVQPTMTESQLEEAFSKFGPIKSLNFGPQRNCAFVDFKSIESTQKAIEQNKVMINGIQVYAEERRSPRYNNSGQQYTNHRRYQQNRNKDGTAISGQRKAGGGSSGVGSLDTKRGGGEQ